jgi:PAS domain S-box-containing protein
MKSVDASLAGNGKLKLDPFATPFFSDEKYVRLLEAAPDAMVIINRESSIVLANSQTENIFGYERNDILGKPIQILISALQLASYMETPIIRSMGSGLSLTGRRKDYSEFPVEVSLSPLETEGDALFIAVAIRDVTERGRAEKKFRGLLEAAPDAIVIADDKGLIVLVNSQTEKLFGYSRDLILGQSFEMLIPQRFHNIIPATNYFVDPVARPMGLELYGLRQDGSEFPVEISYNPLETETGVLVSAAIRDVTERKVFQESLEKANRLKSEFLANMSHELRTPLNGIIGFSEFLIDEKTGPLNPKQKEYLGDVLSSGRHLLQLINDILDLAKVEAGKMEMNIEEFSLRQAIAEVTSIVNPALKKKHLALDVILDPDVDIVNLDQSKMKQVLYNLLSNATKFTEDNGKISLRAHLIENNFIHLEVQDSGIGIKPEDIEKLFIEFQQLDSGSDRRYQGTGLGLALTRSIIEMMGGTIGVSSEYGVGSTFTITFPVVMKTGANK